MMHGRNNGKKLKAMRIVRSALEIMHLLTDQNPLQVCSFQSLSEQSKRYA
jgi:small subunit ribosomal protein S5e